MRTLARWLSIFALAVFAPTPALAADPIQLNTATRFEFVNCASAGSSSQSITAGAYLMRVTGETVWVCYAATCASGGEFYPSGTVMLIKVMSGTAINPAATTTSCRSAASTGSVVFTSAG